MALQDRPFRFGTADGLELRGVSWGEGPAQLVFSPGNGFTVECYRPAIGVLGESATVFGLNPRGFGGSERPSSFAGWETSLNDLRDFVRRTLKPPVILAGHSFGAMLSLWLAAEAPELVRGLLLVDPSLLHGKDEPIPEEAVERIMEVVARTRTRRPQWPRRESAAKFLRGKDPFSGWSEAAFEAFMASGVREHERGGVALACPPWLEAAIYETAPRGQQWGWAGRVRAPTVILRGEDSHTIAPAALTEFARTLPVATVISVKGTHTFPQEHPEETAAAMETAIALLLRCDPEGETAL